MGAEAFGKLLRELREPCALSVELQAGDREWGHNLSDRTYRGTWGRVSGWMSVADDGTHR